MRLARWMLVACTWLVCVGAVAGVAWYAIDSAGRQVRVLGDAPVRWGAPSALPDPQDEALSPTPGPAPTTSPPTPTSTVTPTLGDAAATGPSPASSDGTPDGGAARAPRTTPAQRTSRTPSPRRPTPTGTRSQTTETGGGSVTITCSPSAPIDYVVTPDQGWSGSGKRSGSTEAEITLSRSGSKIEVHAKCDDGKPKTTVEEHRGGDD